MTAIQRYHLRNFIRDSVWPLPVIGLVSGWGVANGLNWMEQRAGWRSGVSPDAARALFGTLAGTMLTFIVFLGSMLLLVLQMASAQLTPRMVGFAFRSRVIRLALTLFTFTFSFTLVVLLRIRDSVPPITSHAAGYLCLLSVGMFLYLVDHVGQKLRPSGALSSVGRLGHEIIRGVYPVLLESQDRTSTPRANVPEGEPDNVIQSARDGVFLGFDSEGLVAEARRMDCVVELVPQVGNFVALGSPLFRVYGGKGKSPAPASVFQHWIALGPERTLQQDPTFAFRIIVDIACKALSPAINDPTTAVLAIDQIHHLLGSVGRRRLDAGMRHDAAGSLRLVYPTPNWEDFVSLAVTEIRQYGGGSIQVVRRLRAMLENLSEVLPAERTGLLREELAVLQRSTRRLFAEAEDRAMANISDAQGVGGKPSEGEAREDDAEKTKE